MKAVCVGSGSEGLQHPEITEAILSMVDQEKVSSKSFNVVYLGTCTYDLRGPMENQTKNLRAAGGNIIKLCVTNPSDRASFDELKELVTVTADIIVISGGNTLFAMDVWRKIKLDVLLKEAADSGVVMCGGSAGFICWFTGGHSDSWDPETYKNFMLDEAKNASEADLKKDEASAAPTNTAEVKSWRYLRVSNLNYFSVRLYYKR